MIILKKFIIPILFVTSLVAIDQFTKYLAVLYLKPIAQHTLIENIFYLFYLENSGMAFGLLQDGRWFFVIFTLMALGFMMYYYLTMPSSRYHTVLRIFLLLLIGGGLGNFIDRVRQGYVVDFFLLRFIDFPVFNVADIFIVIATIAIGIMVLFIKEPAITS